jgi:hypothetical protein
MTTVHISTMCDGATPPAICIAKFRIVAAAVCIVGIYLAPCIHQYTGDIWASARPSRQWCIHQSCPAATEASCRRQQLMRNAIESEGKAFTVPLAAMVRIMAVISFHPCQRCENCAQSASSSTVLVFADPVSFPG